MNSKRNFKKTNEPIGSSSGDSKQSIFVIQQHDASSMHYDFRLESNGVLLSWAVPKGLSTDTHEKRLAIQTEDHPLDYSSFEGVIPEGEYGAGAVIQWDRGTYENIKKGQNGEIIPLDECLKKGKIEVKLHGQKLTGGYALVEFREEKGQWLIIKMKDEEADARRNPVSTEPTSVLSGKTVDEVGNDE